MKRVLHALIVPISLLCMALLIMGQWRQIADISWSIDSQLLILSLIGLIVLFFIDAFGWHLILRSLGQRITAKQSIRVWILSSLTRYLPGGFWPYVSRASLATEHGVGIASSSISLYIETLLLVASALAVGFPALMGAAGLHVHPALVLLVILACGALLHPKSISLLYFIPGSIGKAIATVRLPRLSHIIGLYIYYVLFWAIFAVVFVCFVNAIYPTPTSYWTHIGSTISLAFAIGFVLVFFPGGIGIREAALYFLLQPLLPHTACLLVSIGSRLWIMLGEGFSLLLVSLWGRPRSATTSQSGGT
jgi:glycosyltransferase 2 family protein